MRRERAREELAESARAPSVGADAGHAQRRARAGGDDDRSALARYALAACLTLPILALGAVHDESLLATATALLIALWVSGASLATRGVNDRGRWVARTLWIPVVWSCGQLIPLPHGLLQAISPSAARAWAAADLAASRSHAFHCISMDPAATAFAVTTGACVAAFYAMCWRFAASQPRRNSLAKAVSVVVLVHDAVALAHAAFDIRKPYGSYDSPYAGVGLSSLTAPLVNVNHAAAVAAVAPPLLLGLALESRRPSTRVLAGVGAAASGVVTLLTLSRGGIAVLLVELLAMLAYSLWRRRDLGGLPSVLTVHASTVVALAGGAVWIAAGKLRDELGDTSASKLRLASHGLRVAAEYPLTGAGRGGFGPAFTQYEAPLRAGAKAISPNTTFTHAENWVTQLSADLGIPLAVLFVGLSAFLVAPYAVKALRRASTTGALIALVGLVVHDLADFSMEFAGVGMLAAALLAIVVRGDGGASPRASDASRSHFRRVRIAMTAALLLAITLDVTLSLGKAAGDEQRALFDAWQAKRLDRAKLAAAIHRHPLDAYLVLLGGMSLYPSDEATRHFHRAVVLAPARPQGHFWLARAFAATGRTGQAWAEYRTTIQCSSFTADAVLRDMIAWRAPLDELTTTADSTGTRDTLSPLLSSAGREDDAVANDRDLIERRPPAVAARSRQIRREIKAGARERALQQADALIAIAPAAADGYGLRAELEPDSRAAEGILENGLSHAGEDAYLLEALLRRRGTRLGRAAVVDELERFRRALHSAGGSAWRVTLLEGDIELARGNTGTALHLFVDCASVFPECRHAYERVGLAAEKLHLYKTAEGAYQILAEHSPGEPRFQQAVERTRALRLAAEQPAPPSP